MAAYTSQPLSSVTVGSGQRLSPIKTSRRTRTITMPNLGYTSVPALLKYLRHAEQLGLDCDAALAAADIEREALADNGKRIPSEVHERLLSHLVTASGDQLFGLHASSFVQPGSWSVLGYITMNCATLGEAMSRIVPYEKLVGDMGTSRIEPAGDHLRLIWSCRHQPAEI